MPVRTSEHCAHRASTEALAEEALSGAERRRAQRHLEECTSCRALFRQRTAQRFPRFRNYTVLERIGKGGFGVVYKVIQHAKQRTEALKVLFGKTPRRAAYFENEVHLIAKLRHPNIATLYEAHLGQPPLFYTMEFVEGEQFDDYVRAHHVPLAERINLIKTVAAAIGYAHEQGVVHRDIKPQNILIDAAGQPHLVDFGIAKKLGLADTDPGAAEDQASSPEGALGTFGYIAPEQLAGEHVDERADIYALGALLYHCVTGEPARFATWPQRLAPRLHERQVTRAEDLAAIIARCVDSEPAQRYPSCAALGEDLDHYLAGRPIRARTDPTPASRALRAAAFVLRTRPLSVRVFLVILVAALLTLLSWRAEARWLVPGARAQSTLLVVFGEATWQALAEGRIGADLRGLDAANRKSWRLLYGRLMQRLAEAEPRAVVWDYVFPDCQPQFDEAFIEGIAALRAASIPVIVGVEQLNADGEPEECAPILAAAQGCGTLASTRPDMRAGEWVVPICVRRGFARPMPGLAVAAFAAARHPDADPDLEIQPSAVVLRYRRRSVPSGGSRWYEDTDALRYVHVDRIAADGVLWANDLVYPMHVPLAGADTVPQIAFEDVLAADRRQLRSWFHGRVVVVGQRIPGQDEYPTEGGANVFGCEVQAQVIRSLLAGACEYRFGRQMLAATILLWATLAAGLVGLVPCSRTLSLRWVFWVCAAAFAVGVLGIAVGARSVTNFWQIQSVLAVGTLLATGGPAYLLKALRARQIQLAPEPSWSAADETISTLLATTSSGGTTASAIESVPGGGAS